MGMSAAEFSRQIDAPTNRVTQKLNGRCSITGDTVSTVTLLHHQCGVLAESTELV